MLPKRMSTFTFSGVDEVWGDITAVKLHALNDLQLIMQSFPILPEKHIPIMLWSINLHIWMFCNA